MAEAGIGVDIVEISRMERIMHVTPSFITRMFTEEERAYWFRFCREVHMAEAGIGVDIVEISRMERIMHVTPSFITRMFTEEERAYCDASARPAAHYACRFAAREAVLKSLGAGFGQEGVGRNDVCTSRDSNGKPIAVLSGGAPAVAERRGGQEVALSLSFTGDLALANALAITAESRLCRTRGCPQVSWRWIWPRGWGSKRCVYLT